MTIQNKDFVELEFTGKITGTDEIFDTNIESEAKKANLNTKDLKPFILSVGQKMLPEGLDSDVKGKEVGKEYDITITPDKAFGKRNPQMIRMIPTKLFHEQQINPERGMQLTLDGQLVRILSNSSGRTLVDFNNPLAGKNVSYNYKINKIITDEKEKIDAIQDFLLRKKFEYEIKEDKIIFKTEKEFEQFIKVLAPKFEELLGKKIETTIIEKPKEKPKDNDEESKKEEHVHGPDCNHKH